jgi:hypothetical protein
MRRPKFFLDYDVFCQSLLHLPHWPQTWCCESPSEKLFRLVLIAAEEPRHDQSEQAVYGHILSLLLVERTPVRLSKLSRGFAVACCQLASPWGELAFRQG